MSGKLTKPKVCQVFVWDGQFAFIDEYDLPIVSAFKWRIRVSRRTCYARATSSRSVGNKTISMHRLITGAAPGDIVDHIDRNGLNNCRSNLRFVSHGHNVANAEFTNKYGFRGICFDVRRPNKPWQARAEFNGRCISFGHFASKEDAARAHDVGIYQLRRDPGLRNFPELAAALAEKEER